jgi:type IV secretion system protein VirB1
MFDCPNLAVPATVMQHVINVESSRNPFAIGVVGGRLARQPTNISEAVATAQMLEQQGYNFSLGVSQVNRYNLAKYGLSSYQAAFDVCSNIRAGSQILRECYGRAQDWGKAFSCYYSGNFVTGYKHGYVQKVFASMRQQQAGTQNGFSSASIPVYGKSTRRTVAVSHHPAYSNAPVSDVRGVSRVVLQPNSNAPTVDARYLQDPEPATPFTARIATQDESPVAVQKVVQPQAQDPAFVY